MSEKRVLVAALLSSLFLAWYSRMVITRPPATRPMSAAASRLGSSDAPASSTAKPSQTVGTAELPENEDLITVESRSLRLGIGRSTGGVRRATLKEFRAGASPAMVEFASAGGVLMPLVGDQPLRVESVTSTSESSAEVRGADSDQKQYHILYSLNVSNNLLHIVIERLGTVASTIENREVAFLASWTRADELTNRNNPLEANVLSTNDGRISRRRFIWPWRSQKNVPRGTKLLTLSERYFCISIRPVGKELSVALVPSARQIAIAKVTPPADGRQEFDVYIGPRDYFYLRSAGFEDAFAVGALGQIGLILLFGLSFINGLTHNYGLAIVLFSLLITGFMAPFTLIGMRSMKKMQMLKPEMDRIMAKHKDDAKRANQEVFALYKQHKVSPLGGCLPTLLQMPIFIALFQAMSHFIQLRGSRFLWIADLSLPDRAARLPLSIPFLGNELNALPLVMALAMYVQTRVTQQGARADESNPSAQILSGPFMPILFCVMFYHFPSGLVLYWLTNSLLGILLYRLVS